MAVTRAVELQVVERGLLQEEGEVEIEQGEELPLVVAGAATAEGEEVTLAVAVTGTLQGVEITMAVALVETWQEEEEIQVAAMEGSDLLAGEMKQQLGLEPH